MRLSGFFMPVGAAEGCDLLIFRLRFKCLGKDRSLASLDSSYAAKVAQASALSVLAMSCKTVASPFSPQYKAIICRSASTL